MMIMQNYNIGFAFGGSKRPAKEHSIRLYASPDSPKTDEKMTNAQASEQGLYGYGKNGGRRYAKYPTKEAAIKAGELIEETPLIKSEEGGDDTASSDKYTTAPLPSRDDIRRQMREARGGAKVGQTPSSGRINTYTDVSEKPEDDTEGKNLETNYTTTPIIPHLGNRGKMIGAAAALLAATAASAYASHAISPINNALNDLTAPKLVGYQLKAEPSAWDVDPNVFFNRNNFVDTKQLEEEEAATKEDFANNASVYAALPGQFENLGFHDKDDAAVFSAYAATLDSAMTDDNGRHMLCGSSEPTAGMIALATLNLADIYGVDRSNNSTYGRIFAATDYSPDNLTANTNQGRGKIPSLGARIAQMSACIDEAAAKEEG